MDATLLVVISPQIILVFKAGFTRDANILRGEAQRTSIRLMKVEPGTLFPEVAIVQVLHVLTEDSGLNLDSAHRAPDLLRSPHGGNLLTIQLGVVLIPVAQNFLLEVKLLREKVPWILKGISGGLPWILSWNWGKLP